MNLDLCFFSSCVFLRKVEVLINYIVYSFKINSYKLTDYL